MGIGDFYLANLGLGKLSWNLKEVQVLISRHIWAQTPSTKALENFEYISFMLIKHVPHRKYLSYVLVYKDIHLSPPAPEDNSGLLLMVTWSTSSTEFASNSVQFYEKTSECAPIPTLFWGAAISPFNPRISLLTGIIVEDTFMLCDGYTSSGVRECYKFVEGQGFQARHVVHHLTFPMVVTLSTCTGNILKIHGGWLRTHRVAPKVFLKPTSNRTPPH